MTSIAKKINTKKLNRTMGIKPISAPSIETVPLDVSALFKAIINAKTKNAHENKQSKNSI